MEPTSKRILKVIAETRDGNFYNIPEEETEKFYRKLSPYSKRSGSWWYLHGELQSRVGYDKGFITNILPEEMNETCTDIALEGIYPIEVVGIPEPCIGYFWVTRQGMGRGLVCLESDVRERMEAEALYSVKAELL